MSNSALYQKNSSSGSIPPPLSGSTIIGVTEYGQIYTKDSGSNVTLYPTSSGGGGPTVSASYAVSSSWSDTAGTTISASWAVSSSRALSTVSSSYALSASYAPAGVTTIITGSTVIQGGTSGRIPYNSASIYQEDKLGLYFESVSPYAHAFAAGRTGTITGVNNTVFGFEAGKTLTIGTNNTYIGYKAGAGSYFTDSYNVVIGAGAAQTLSAEGYISKHVIIGRDAMKTLSYASEASVIIGDNALSAGNSRPFCSVVIGANATLTGWAFGSIGIGHSVAITADQQCNIGSTAYPIANVNFNGITHSSPVSIKINATGGSGTNVNGANLILAGGRGTGNASASGSILFQTAPSGSSSSTAQTLETRLTITQYGTLRAGNIHNNLDPTGSSSQQDIRSGTYIPELSDSINLDASSSLGSNWMRVGNVVSVSGRLSLDATNTTTSSSVNISLPINSYFISESDASGTAFCSGVSGFGAEIWSKVGSNSARLSFISTDVTSQKLSYYFQYLVR